VLDQPLAKAAVGNKLVLIEFTTADADKKFDTEVLSTPDFNDYADKNLVLVKVDLSPSGDQSAPLKAANAAWQKRFQVSEFPTYILVDGNCRAFGRQNGYLAGGPKAFIQKLDAWKGAAVATSAGTAQWLTDLPQAQALAKAQNKLVLVDFTGSDWCGWCMKLDADTLSKPEFIDYARKNLVLVQLDYPRQTYQPPALKSANAALQAKYDVHGFPTLIALTGDGEIVYRADGYLEGGPAVLIGRLDAARQK